MSPAVNCTCKRSRLHALNHRETTQTMEKLSSMKWVPGLKKAGDWHKTGSKWNFTVPQMIFHRRKDKDSSQSKVNSLETAENTASLTCSAATRGYGFQSQGGPKHCH